MLLDNLWRDAIRYEADKGDGSGSPDEAPIDDGDNPQTEDLQAQIASLQAELKRVNAESAERRIKIREIEEAETARKEAEMSEIERAKAQAQKAEDALKEREAQYRQDRIRYAVEMTATQMQFHDPGDAYKLLNLSDVTVGEDGEVIGAKAALETLAKDKPHLIKNAIPPSDINARNRGTGSPPTTQELADQKRKSGAYVAL